MTFRVPLAVALLAFLLPPTVSAQEHAHPAGEALGKVTFPVSCTAEAGKEFERGVAMLHSFWFEQAVASFQRTATLDPKCGMAHWGVAMTLWGNPMARVLPAQDRSRSALDAAQKAVELTRTATPREQAYAEAALALYRDYEGKTFAQRMQAHEQAMALVHQRAPDDPEAAMFHARAMIANAPPTDLTFARQVQAAQMLEPLFVKQPDHPGLAHYIIHAFDAPATAKQGLDAAKRYAGIAPSAPHALHMPSHIFTRLGYWQESIETNSKSARAEPDSNAAVHPNDYMVYAYLQLGQDEAARKVIERSVNDPDRFYTSIVGYNYAAMAARYALERNRWEDAAKLTRLPGSPPLHVEAIPRFTRAIGAARSNNLALAREEVAALDQLRQKLEQANDTYWATLTDAQRMAAAAWLAHAEKNDAEAVRLARSAAEREESVEKHPVTPGPLLPARELEGDLLLELKRYPDALASYEKVLQREPRRARAVFGAGRAAELANNRTAARKYYTELLELLKNADATRAEPKTARAYLEKTGN